MCHVQFWHVFLLSLFENNRFWNKENKRKIIFELLTTARRRLKLLVCALSPMNTYIMRFRNNENKRKKNLWISERWRCPKSWYWKSTVTCRFYTNLCFGDCNILEYGSLYIGCYIKARLSRRLYWFFWKSYAKWIDYKVIDHMVFCPIFASNVILSETKV